MCRLCDLIMTGAGATQPLDRDPPAGRPRRWVTVLARDRLGLGLVAHSELQVDLIDVNDNRPVFTRDFYLGSVTESTIEGWCQLEAPSAN